MHRSEGWHFGGANYDLPRTNVASLETLKLRLDKLLLDRGLAASRERAQALILAGKVLVNEQKLDKAGAHVPDDSTLRLLGDDLKYVSRGGLKLERALEYWQINAEGKTALRGRKTAAPLK